MGKLEEDIEKIIKEETNSNMSQEKKKRIAKKITNVIKNVRSSEKSESQLEWHKENPSSDEFPDKKYYVTMFNPLCEENPYQCGYVIGVDTREKAEQIKEFMEKEDWHKLSISEEKPDYSSGEDLMKVTYRDLEALDYGIF